MRFEVRIGELLDGAKRASGQVVIIDVFPASRWLQLRSLGGGFSMVGRVDHALALRQTDIGQTCMYKVGGRLPLDFDLGNSPFQVTQMVVAGKTIIQHISAGMQGIVAAAVAE